MKAARTVNLESFAEKLAQAPNKALSTIAVLSPLKKFKRRVRVK